MRNSRRARGGHWVTRTAVAALVAVGVVGASGSTTAQDRGFVMVGADAAYASFEGAAPADANCHVSVGLVRAKAVWYFDGELVKPHSDLQVVFDSCGALTGAEGVVPTVDHPDASIRKLRSASVGGIEVPITVADASAFPGAVIATVDLEWTATGRRYTQAFSDEFGWSFHRTRAAEVSGSVTVDVDGAPWKTFTDTELVELGQPEIMPQITRYSEVYRPAT